MRLIKKRGTRRTDLLTHGRVFLLACSVENIENCCLVINSDLLAVAVLDGGIIPVGEGRGVGDSVGGNVLENEVVLDELDS